MLALLLVSQAAWAALTDISNTPLINASVSSKPNIMLILDSSGSMSSDYMPDAAGLVGNTGLKASQCNGVAYNPSSEVSYTVPVQADGSPYPSMSLTAAANDGYNLSTRYARTSATSLRISQDPKTLVMSSVTYYAVGNLVTIANGSNSMTGLITALNPSSKTITVDVSSSTGSGSFSSWTVSQVITKDLTTDASNNYYYAYSGAQPALSWTYNETSSTVITTTPFYKECDTGQAAGPNGTTTTVLTKVMVSTLTPAQQKNYANWYSYYRTRINMMRSATGQAFQVLNSNYRVGFTTIGDNTVTASSTFVNADDFGAAQKATFYASLYSADPSGGTPLRKSLSKVGRYFAKKAPAQSYDPMQNSCQRNYAILTTDGYWNDSDTDALKIDGTQINQQDGFDERPMYDGSMNVVTTKTTTKSVQQQKIVTVKTSVTSLGTKYVVTSALCLLTNKTDTPGNGTETTAQTQTLVNNVTTSVVRTVVTTNGKVSSDDTATTVSTSTVSNNTVSATPIVNWTASGPASTPYCALFASPGTTYIRGTPVVTNGTPVTTVVSNTGPTTTTTTTTQTSGGATNTLADIAEYYYKTDLRDSSLSNCSGNGEADVCANQVPASGQLDTISTQHMTTYTVGLGVSGLVTYDKNYLTQTSGDFYNITRGLNPRPNWPAPVSDKITTVDDLWHAAVNGRGQYFSAGDPNTLTKALSGVFEGINSALGTGGAASSSSLTPSSGTDQVFQTSYKSQDWTGDVQSNITVINPISGALSYTSAWTAQSQLDNKLPSARTIYYMKTVGSGASATRTLKPFQWAGYLDSDSTAGTFDGFCNHLVDKPAQCTSLALDATKLLAANSGLNLVNWLRGDQTYGQANASMALYRTRKHILGDIIGSSPAYVGKPRFKYTDAGYAAFVTSQKDRKGMVYVGGNDGMLHAFSADASDGGTGGQEKWAFVPTMVMPNLYKLASTAYATNHQYLVDGTPVAGDVKSASGTWKTIVVAGLGLGGRGYFALDVTSETTPLPLWEFTDADLGLSVGNPFITKRADGTWVVIFSSGYNNSGIGYLYVLDANTGVQLLKIPTKDTTNTAVGSAGTPSGLGKINVWVENTSDNTTKRVYGGDLLGNLWRFDLDNLVQPHQASLLLAKLKSSPTVVQPITTKPELSTVKYNGVSYPAVFVGTGRYLGTTDLTDTGTQTIYGIKDPMNNTSWGDVRGDTRMVAQTFTTIGSGTSLQRTASTNAVNWTTGIGWRVDLPSSGERVAFDPSLQYNIFGVLSAIPGASTCVASGSSWRYFIDVATGSALSSSNGIAGTYLGNSIATGLSWIQTSSGPLTITTYSDGRQTIDTPPKPPTTQGKLRRTSWRELLN